MTLTKTNLAFYKKLTKVLKKNPAATHQDIAWDTNNTLGAVSWGLSVLKKAKHVKRDKKGNLVTLK